MRKLRGDMGVPRIERETIIIFNDEEDLGYV